MVKMFAVPDEFLPLAFMFLATVIGLIIGTSWGVFAVMFPFVLVVAKGGQLEPELLNMIFGAIISASVFINQSSKQADNVIVTSQCQLRVNISMIISDFMLNS